MARPDSSLPSSPGAVPVRRGDSPRARDPHTVALWAALLVTVLWSSSWVLIRRGLDDESLSPLTFAGLRYTVAALVLWAWTIASTTRRRALGGVTRRDLGRLVVLGVVLYSVAQGAQFVAIDNQPAATSSLVLSLTPLVVGLAAVRSLGERASRRQLVGAVLVAGGAWLYFTGSLAATVVGMAASLVGLGANSTGSLLGRSVNRDHRMSPLVVTLVSMSVGAVLLLAVGIASEGWPTVTLRAAVLVGWLAVVNTAVAFTLWNHSLRHLSAIESAGVNNTMLIQIALLAWVFLGEAPGLVGMVGIVVVSGGIFLTRARARQPADLPRTSGQSLGNP